MFNGVTLRWMWKREEESPELFSFGRRRREEKRVQRIEGSNDPCDTWKATFLVGRQHLMLEDSGPQGGESSNVWLNALFHMLKANFVKSQNILDNGVSESDHKYLPRRPTDRKFFALLRSSIHRILGGLDIFAIPYKSME
ncbi:hypothetical protein Fot_36965 [Forsythia ovata]|uniref:Uncharacterized protein n=1 Tax=Forsythia ovata TaxID=205694 RepID=A0ABD1SQX8_9LAMI